MARCLTSRSPKKETRQIHLDYRDFKLNVFSVLGPMLNAIQYKPILSSPNTNPKSVWRINVRLPPPNNKFLLLLTPSMSYLVSDLVWHFCSHSGSLKHWPMSVLLLTKLQSFLGTAEAREASRRQRTSGDT